MAKVGQKILNVKIFALLICSITLNYSFLLQCLYNEMIIHPLIAALIIPTTPQKREEMQVHTSTKIVMSA